MFVDFGQLTISGIYALNAQSQCLFLLFEQELHVHVTYGFSDHVERLVLGIQSLEPLLFYFLPFVLHIGSEYLEFLHHHSFHKFLKIL